MIIVGLDGGLGNQMFNYAFGRSLAYDLNTKFLLDDSFLDYKNFKYQILNIFSKVAVPGYNFLCSNSNYFNENFILNPKNMSYKNKPKHVNFALDCFKIKKGVINHNLLKSNINQAKKNIIDMSSRKYYKHFVPINENINLPAYFKGFFFFEEYFKHNEDIIRKDFEFKDKVSGKNKEIVENMLDSRYESVALHFRLGDFISSSDVNVCSLNYYQNAIKYILNNVKNPKFFIFSDNVNWVKKHINIPEPNYFVVNNSGEKSYEDLRLMSLCNHFIIANSTFSWWGSWLSKNEDKIVVQPKPFYISQVNDTASIEGSYIPIKNDYSAYFNESNKTLFNLNKSNSKESILKVDNVSLINEKEGLKVSTYKKYSKLDSHFNDNFLRHKSIKNISKIFFKDIQKINENNYAILRLNFLPKKEGLFRIFYLTKNDSIYTSSKTFPVYYDKNEEVDSFILISPNVLLKGLIFVPSLTDNDILIKNLEFKEVNYYL